MAPITRIGSGGIEPSDHRLGSFIFFVNTLGKHWLPEVVEKVLMARGDAAGVPAMEPIREIREIAFKPALGLAVVGDVPAWEAHAGRERGGPMTLSFAARPLSTALELGLR